MQNDNWSWANEPRPERLLASWYSDDELVFEDREANEQVVVTLLPNFGLAFNGIPALDGQHFVKGEGVTERDVWHVITRDHCQALRAGLTVHRSVYSSLPHEFELKPVSGFEEVFLFLIPDGGTAVVQGNGMWPDGSYAGGAWIAEDRQLCQIPMGAHPVTALLDKKTLKISRVSYIWCYLALEGRGWEKD